MNNIKQDNRIELTKLIQEKSDHNFKYFKELKKRYKIPIGIILIESKNKLSLKNIIRLSDNYIDIKYNNKHYYICFILFAGMNELYTVVKKIENHYPDTFLYFEDLDEDLRKHIQNFTDTLFFDNEEDFLK